MVIDLAQKRSSCIPSYESQMASVGRMHRSGSFLGGSILRLGNGAATETGFGHAVGPATMGHYAGAGASSPNGHSTHFTGGLRRPPADDMKR